MKELLTKIRRADEKSKCKMVAEVYLEFTERLESLDESFNTAGINLNVNVFDHALDEMEAVLNELEGLMNPEMRELLATLEKRFVKNKKLHSGITWQQVEQRLKVAGKEKLQSLNEMEKTGGEPDVIKVDQKTGEVIFYDCSAESPTGRRDCVYDREGQAILKRDYPNGTCSGNAVDIAAKMGVELLNEEQYRELQTLGEFDKDSWSWLKTPFDKRKEGVALYGDRVEDDVSVYEYVPYAHNDVRGWRGLLRV